MVGEISGKFKANTGFVFVSVPSMLDERVDKMNSFPRLMSSWPI